jgi:addiction module HigA family antidote
MIEVKPELDILGLEREPTHPGEILLEDFLLPLGITQTKLAHDLGVSFKTINEIINQKRNITPDISLRFSKYFGTSPQVWLGLQMDYELYKAFKNKKVKKHIQEIKPLEMKV